ncbi:alpha/beta fold hydrolase [Hoeflea prorocentri]|uniref:Alpha/beta hydrolase n=1 Tax=Hoeflea prorocentri TaxID=1922333 RepID=A0A9X3UEA6_9HYPH|nr:alpha/beta hydrolase [Hoeflea prorocentri]MCY6379239.1 alpha/beta hydrolase [Hoeflea prorocentri]MDA5397040.1 alpha/beta hydrolase [Hoeflea prorocentri]
MDKKAPISTCAIHDTPDNPAPKNATSGFFETGDGKRLRYALFRSEVTRAKGTVVLLQGRNETIEKYYETIRDLTEAGLWVATFDWRGQGGSERLLQGSNAGHVQRFADYESDLEYFLENIVLPDTRLPFFIVAHSTGGLIALSAAPRLANRVERMVLTSPFVGMHPGKYDGTVLRLLVRAASLIGLGRKSTTGTKQRNLTFEDNALTSDRARFNRNRAIYDVCPDFILGGPTFRWLAESFKTMKRIHDPAHLASVRIPTLIFGAGADSIVPIQEIEQIASHFRASELITIDHAKHELFQETDIYREQVLAGIRAFLPGEA